MNNKFKLVSKFQPSGEQPQAIEKLTKHLKKKDGQKYSTLLGVTGSGKTFTLANVIKNLNKPILILSHNKTLAAQLFSEFKGFFPKNAVEYFISYYDYYLPESYIPQTDTYIAKDAGINENIERFRLSATSSLIERRDVIIVASVSCIYGLGSPEDYEFMSVTLEIGNNIDRNEFLKKLINIQYERNDTAPNAGEFRVRGDSVDIFLPQREEMIRVKFWGDEVEGISSHDIITGNKIAEKNRGVFFPCKHFVLPEEKIKKACDSIKNEMIERVNYFENNNLLVEAQRIYQRTKYDMEMLNEIGYCSGIENYSSHFTGRAPGSRPFCLIDFFPDDFITIIDESHVTLPQIRAMYKADRSRKQTLVDHGFRLPSALDNRPLMFEEFSELTGNTIFVSATPGDFETEHCPSPIEQVIRPTGLLDPLIEIRPLEGQIDDLMEEIRKYAAKNERILVTTLTKKSAERLSDYLVDLNLKVKYIHSELDAIQRVKILSELRKGIFDCLIGINLLREGIDLPEVSLVAILDADKEGFLRSERSLIQVAGRAARNAQGKVILYADRITNSIKTLCEISDIRRKKQKDYNKKHGIIPKTIIKEIKDYVGEIAGASKKKSKKLKDYSQQDINDTILELETEMLAAAEALEFERAADLRDMIAALEKELISDK
jgi:excinuclease ABC subunit B